MTDQMSRWWLPCITAKKAAAKGEKGAKQVYAAKRCLKGVYDSSIF